MAVPDTTVSALVCSAIGDCAQKPQALSDEGSLGGLSAKRCTVTLTMSPRPVPAPGSSKETSMRVCTDHMVLAHWTLDHGWNAPSLQPYGPLSLEPTASCLHYATECFEGMKLYRGVDGQLRLFRPQLNVRRMLVSASRVALSAFPPEELLALIERLCAADGPRWLPRERGGSILYIRPMLLASDAALGLQRPREAMLVIVLACFPCLDTAAAGLKLLASHDDMVRAWPGGFGFAKVGANYGPTLVAQGEARQMGFQQVLWLFGDDGRVTEAGASNFFVVWRTRDGALQLVTAPLDDGIILDGITRRSILELARARLAESASADCAPLEPIEVLERYFCMADVLEAAREERLLEAFAVGTAYFVSPVGLIRYRDVDIKVPLRDGGYAATLKKWPTQIMWGEVQHEWGHIVDEE